MTGSADNRTLLREMESLLADSRRRIRRATVRAGCHDGLDRASRSIAGFAAAYCVVGLLFRLSGDTIPLGWTGYCLLTLLAAAVSGLLAIVGAMQQQPSLREAAERLDLNVADHNRIATAICLAETNADTLFTAAAIRDGMSHLQRFRHELPRLDDSRVNWRRVGRMTAAFVALTLVAGLLVHGGGPKRPATPVPLPVADATSRPAPSRAEDPRRNPEAPTPPPPPQNMTVSKRTGRTEAAPKPPAGARNEKAVGRATGEGGADAAPSGQTATTSGEPTEASANAKSSGRKESPKAPTKPSKESKIAGGPKPEKAEESSSIGQGASGGGAMSAVRHSWSQREQTAEADRDQDDSDEPAENETDANTQRGGVQPSLKDRNESPSRDLGISGDEGPPGAGRGGPSPPKKSRGTASLVLGVPVPDFVKGRLGPGVTKVTHERVEPTPMPGDFARPTDAASRAMPESPSPRFDVPSSFAAYVRSYLIALHSADRNRPAESGSVAPSAPGNQRSNATP